MFLWLTTNYWALRGKQATFVVGPDFSVVGSDSAAELAGEVAPLEPQLHPLQLVPQRAHAPRIVTQHTQNLPACQRSFLTTLPCSVLTHLTQLTKLPPAIGPALLISILRMLSLSILTVLPACQRSILRVYPLCMLRIWPLSILLALSFSKKSASCHSAFSLRDHSAYSQSPCMLT